MLYSADGSQRLDLTNGKTDYEALAWSPDGTALALYHWDGIDLVVQSDGVWSPPVSLYKFDETDPRPWPQLGFDWSPDGSTVVYASEDFDGSISAFAALNIFSGRIQELHTGPFYYVEDPRFSPDLDAESPGYQGAIVFASNGDIWRLDVVIDADGNLQQGPLKNLTESDEPLLAPLWSPDLDPQSPGYQGLIAYSVQGQRLDGFFHGKLYFMTPDGADHWLVSDDFTYIDTWSSDGAYLVFQAAGGQWDADLYRVDAFADDLMSTWTRITDTQRTSESRARWNPVWDPNGPGAP